VWFAADELARLAGLPPEPSLPLVFERWVRW